MLRVSDLTTGYGDEQVLQSLSLSVDSGEVVAIIGPSGVGKTTLLRILALSHRPDEGTVELDGTDAWAVDEEERLALRRRVGMVFQQASLFDASVARNAEYGLRVRRSWEERVQASIADAVGSWETKLRSSLGGLAGPFANHAPWSSENFVGSNGLDEAVEEALSVVGLSEKIDQHASSLSGGEAQRVSFARALAYDPDVLLLDEPTSDLDPRNTAVIEEAIAEARERGIGVVVATHDMHQAERVADRVAVLLDGDFTEVDDAERVFENPREERTRKFISGELIY